MGPIEKEFDPTEFSPELLAVEREESIASILNRVGEALKRTPNVVLVIPRGTLAFHTTHDFLALGKLQWTGEVRVAVASPDPTIAGLARVLGFHIVEPPAGHPAIADDPSFDQGTTGGEGIEQPTSPLPLGGAPEWVISPSIPVLTTPSSSLTTSTWLNMPGDGPPQSRVVPSTRSGMPPPRTKPRQTGVLLPTHISEAHPLTPVIDPAKVDDPKTEDGDAKVRRAILDAQAVKSKRRWRYNSAGRTMRWGRVLATLAVLLVVALIAGSAYAYVYLPEGTISVRPLGKSYPLKVQIPVLIATSQGGGQQAIVPAGDTGSSTTVINGTPITGIPLSAPLSEEGSAAATGTRQVAVGQAKGTMHFANTTSISQFVPAGTQFQAPNGVFVKTTQALTVEANNYLAGTIGDGYVGVVANVAGPDGNIGAGQLTGLYAGALQYTNGAMTGGSTQTLKVVTQADIDGVAAGLIAKVQNEVTATIALQVQQGKQGLITQTISASVPEVAADHKAGDDGETVNVKVTAVARAYAYDVQEMDDEVAPAVKNWISTASNIPASAGADLSGPVTHDAPVLVSVDSQTGQAIYETNATAQVKFTLTPDMQGQIRDLVKGQDVAKAIQLINQTYGGYINAGPIQAKVLWFDIGKLPTDPAHIVVQLGSDTPIGSVAQPTTQKPGNARPIQR